MKMRNERSSMIVPYVDIADFVNQLFFASGLDPEDSSTATSVILFSESRGFKSHGLKNVSRIYIPQILNGTISTKEKGVIERAEGSYALIDANRALGLTVGKRAIEQSLSIASKEGIGAVFVKNSTHFGPAGYFSHLAASCGYVSIVASNLGAQVITPPPGGSTPMLGTNPISIAAPGGTLPPFCLDMSTTVTSTGSLREKMESGLGIPSGQLRKVSGEWSTNPEDYFKGIANLVFLGSSVETGAMKGFGLALAVDILCGVLTGSGVGPRMELLGAKSDILHPPKNDIGHMFIVIDPAKILGSKGTFYDGMEAMLKSLLQCPSIDGTQLSYPGYREELYAQKAKQMGIDISEELREELLSLGKKLNINCRLLEGANTYLEDFSGVGGSSSTEIFF